MICPFLPDEWPAARTEVHDVHKADVQGKFGIAIVNTDAGIGRIDGLKCFESAP